MPILWEEYTYPKHQPLPKGYIEGRDWAYEHGWELSEKYPNQWLAIYNKEVISFGDLGFVKKAVSKKAIGGPVFYYFAQQHYRYLDKTGVRDESRWATTP